MFEWGMVSLCGQHSPKTLLMGEQAEKIRGKMKLRECEPKETT
jgi:hypothetical protein